MVADRSSGNTARLLWAMAAACVVALALALLAQYQWDMRPCPWCVLQRLLFAVIAALCAIAALVASRPARQALTTLSIATAVAGVASALYQHNVAAESASCALTFADRVVGAVRLDALLPSVFSATASCAEAAVSVLGVPFAYWSLALFVLLGAAGIAVVGRIRRGV